MPAIEKRRSRACLMENSDWGAGNRGPFWVSSRTNQHSQGPSAFDGRCPSSRYQRLAGHRRGSDDLTGHVSILSQDEIVATQRMLLEAAAEWWAGTPAAPFLPGGFDLLREKNGERPHGKVEREYGLATARRAFHFRIRSCILRGSRTSQKSSLPQRKPEVLKPLEGSK